MARSGSNPRIHLLQCLGLLLLVTATPRAASGIAGVGYNRGDTAPGLTLNDQNDNPVSLSDFRGKNLLLTFSAMWCGPCQAAAPVAEELVKGLNDDGEPSALVDVLIENEYGDPAETEDAQNWAGAFGLTSPVLSVDGNSNSQGTRQFFNYSGKYGGPALPTEVLLTPHGRIINVYIGFSTSRIRLDFSRHRSYDPRVMVDRLLSSVEALDPQTDLSASLENQLQATLHALDLKDMKTGCGRLSVFIDQVQSETKKGLTADQAAALTDAAQKIRTELGCE